MLVKRVYLCETPYCCIHVPKICGTELWWKKSLSQTHGRVPRGGRVITKEIKLSMSECLNNTKTALSLDRAVPYPGPHPPHQSKTDIKFSSIWQILVDGLGCLHHLPWEWYRADHPLRESREFDLSKLKWRRTKDRFRLGNKNVSSTRQAQGLDCYSVGCTVVWLRSSGWSAQSPRAVHGLLESLRPDHLHNSTPSHQWQSSHILGLLQ